MFAISELSLCSFCSCLPLRNMKNTFKSILKNRKQRRSFPLISDGQINQDVLELIHKDESWLTQEVKQAGYNNVSDIFLGEYISGQLRLTGYSNHQKGSK
ncbi:DUF421 domain-containing protein [Lactobacillus amylolyticus]|nr:DUF421 domain-containing protein [Lactobacillus amylolyticus]